MVKPHRQTLTKMVIIPCTYYKQTTLYSCFVSTSSNEPVKIAKSLIPLQKSISMCGGGGGGGGYC